MPRMRQMKMYLSIRHALHTIIRESINVVDKLRGLYHILTSFREKNKCYEDTICISTTFIIEPRKAAFALHETRHNALRQPSHSSPAMTKKLTL